MRQKRHIWKTFSAWEADAFRQYLEALSSEGWYPESIGNMGMDCYRGEPEKRRYAVMIASGISSLTGTDSWTADRFREQCEAAGWKFQCSGNLWQIFYTTDDSLELTEEMSDAAQFKTQKTLVFNWSVMLLYPLISVLECWLVYQYFKNPGATFSDPGKVFSLAVSLLLLISYTWAYIQLTHWKRQSEQSLKKSGKMPVMDLEKVLIRKRYEKLFLVIMLSAALTVSFSTSIRDLLITVLSASLIVGIALFMRKMIQEYGSGDQREDWTGYLVGVAVLATILVPICGGLIGQIGSGEEDIRRKSTVFASCRKNDFYVRGAETPVGVVVYESKIPWIIEKTKRQYPKDLEELWDRKEVDASEIMDTLPDGASISWYRYTIREGMSVAEIEPLTAAAESEETKTEQIPIETLFSDTQTAVDEVILSDKTRLVILDFGGGTDEKGVEEAIAKFFIKK